MAEQKQQTLTFSLQETKELEMKKALQEVYAALTEKGYNPINQIVGYILSGDPTYITNYKNARGIIRRIDIDELLNVLVRNYLNLGWNFMILPPAAPAPAGRCWGPLTECTRGIGRCLRGQRRFAPRTGSPSGRL